jgi:hypothetical protein
MPTWDNGTAAGFMPERYTSRELVNWRKNLDGYRSACGETITNFKHSASRFIVMIVHPQKDVPVGRAVDTVKKIRPELK